MELFTEAWDAWMLNIHPQTHADTKNDNPLEDMTPSQEDLLLQQVREVETHMHDEHEYMLQGMTHVVVKQVPQVMLVTLQMTHHCMLSAKQVPLKIQPLPRSSA